MIDLADDVVTPEGWAQQSLVAGTGFSWGAHVRSGWSFSPKQFSLHHGQRSARGFVNRSGCRRVGGPAFRGAVLPTASPERTRGARRLLEEIK